MCSQFDAIYIGVHADWIDYTKDLLNRYKLSNPALKVVVGGTSRTDTIINILNAIETDFDLPEDCIVVTHDAVRPFVKLSTIEKNIETARRHGSCDTVIPATDTILRSDETCSSIETIPTRDRMYQGQTPQSFSLRLFRESLSTLDEAAKNELTDACKVLVEAGHGVKLVRGDTTNIKLTTIMDYKIALAMIESELVD